MTAITATIHRPHKLAPWVAILSAAVLVAGLAVGLLLSLAGSSNGNTTPIRTSVVSNTNGSGGQSLCPGSKKDWTC